MPEFIRNTVYLYLYEKGLPIKNIGFIKRNVYEDKDKLTIHIKGLYTTKKEKGDVFVLSDTGNIYHCEQIGEIFVENSVGDSRITIEHRDCHKGIMVHIAEKICLAGFEEEKLNIRKIEFLDEDKDENDVSENDVSENDAGKNNADNENTANEWTSKREKSKEAMSEKEITVVNKIMTKHTITEDKIAEQAVTEQMKAEDAMAEHTVAEQAVAEQTMAEQAVAEQTMTEQAVAEQKVTNQALRDENNEMVWNKLASVFPMVHPFENAVDAEYLSITPNELQFFRKKEMQALISNSFLQHAYYSYKYIILGRELKNEKSVGYHVGVPGTYHEREVMMAKMFGFEKFLCAKKEETAQGCFGYYLKIF